MTTTTPETITTSKTVKGTAWQINPPVSLILTLENGKNQEFKIPIATKFDVDGWPGMGITVTKITEALKEVVEQQKPITGTMSPEASPDLPMVVAWKKP